MTQWWLHKASRYPHAELAAVRRQQRMAAVLTALRNAQDQADSPGLLLQAVITFGQSTAEGQLDEAVSIPWFEIVQQLARDPQAMYQIDWRKWEEIIAGAYRQAGFDVVLTPRSNDGGCDVIATSRALGTIRFIDQVKAYGPGNLVTADDVRALIGVLTLRPNVSKGVITTTSGFAPGVLRDPDIARLMPYRLELRVATSCWSGSRA